MAREAVTSAPPMASTTRSAFDAFGMTSKRTSATHPPRLGVERRVPQGDMSDSLGGLRILRVWRQRHRHTIFVGDGRVVVARAVDEQGEVERPCEIETADHGDSAVDGARLGSQVA